MSLTRRRALRALGVATAGGLAGCLTGWTADDGDDGDGDSGVNNGDLQRCDEPPGEITVPQCPPAGDERDPLWLCADTTTEPTITFEQAETNTRVLSGEGLEWDTDSFDTQFYATLLTDADDLDRVNLSKNLPAIELVEGAAFDSEAVLVVQTGWGSPDVTPHLKRIEPTAEGVHAFGCYRRPCQQSDSLGERTAVARFQQPETLDSATVSLIVDPETRVTFRSTEGVVTIE